MWCLAKGVDFKWSVSEQKCIELSKDMSLITTYEECYKKGQTSKIIIDDTNRTVESELKLRFDMPYNKINEQREVLWIFKNTKDTDLDINMYCLGER